MINNFYDNLEDKVFTIILLGILKQDALGEVPYTLQDFCIGCGRCSIVCPFKAIKMM